MIKIFFYSFVDNFNSLVTYLLLFEMLVYTTIFCCLLFCLAAVSFWTSKTMERSNFVHILAFQNNDNHGEYVLIILYAVITLLYQFGIYWYADELRTEVGLISDYLFWITRSLKIFISISESERSGNLVRFTLAKL